MRLLPHGRHWHDHRRPRTHSPLRQPHLTPLYRSSCFVPQRSHCTYIREIHLPQVDTAHHTPHNTHAACITFGRFHFLAPFYGVLAREGRAIGLWSDGVWV